MQSVQRWSVRSSLVVVALIVTAPVTSSCEPIGLIDSPIGFSEGEPADTLKPPGGAATLHDLARECDVVDRHVELDGSIVADRELSVWGQARLTMYREEFETQMLTQLTTFQPTLQGAVSRQRPGLCGRCPLAPADTAGRVKRIADREHVERLEQLVELFQLRRRWVGHLDAVDDQILTEPSTGTFDAFNNVTRTPAFMQPMPGFAVFGQKGLSLEPTVQIEQMARYINHLQELRRDQRR